MPDAEMADQKAGVELSRLREMKPKEIGVRFVFGAVASAVAATVGIVWGPKLGGLFLAFPAILPAAMTMLQKHEGRERADEASWGAIGGAAGLICFAVALTVCVDQVAGVIALLVALAVWMIVSGVAWWGISSVLIHQGSRSSAANPVRGASRRRHV